MTRLLLLATVLAGCYDRPEPNCGFVCGPSSACPADYACAADRHCHRIGAPDSLVCGTPDAAPDSPPDSPAGPRVLATQPADGTFGIAVDVLPTAVIDQDIVQFDPLGITLTEVNVGPIEGHGESPPASMAVRFVPTYQLPANQMFNVRVTASAVVATYGPLAAFQWSFNTGDDNIPPHAVFIDPPANATMVGPGTAVSVDFDEVVQGVDTTSFTITDGVTPVAGTISTTGGHSYVFTPTAPLASATTYTVTYGSAIHDATGNALVTYSYSFTTQ